MFNIFNCNLFEWAPVNCAFEDVRRPSLLRCYHHNKIRPSYRRMLLMMSLTVNGIIRRLKRCIESINHEYILQRISADDDGQWPMNGQKSESRKYDFVIHPFFRINIRKSLSFVGCPLCVDACLRVFRRRVSVSAARGFSGFCVNTLYLNYLVD